MRELICGGRDFRDQDALRAYLDGVLALDPDLIVIVGYDPDDPKFQGADELAYCWAKDRGVPVMPFPAPWHRFGRSAGPRRNGRMLADAKPQRVRAFPGGDGTMNMVARADRAGVPVEKVGWR